MAEPHMWGSNIVGFGTYRYQMGGFEQHDELLKSPGNHKTAKACLYINKLADVDLPTLRRLFKQSVQHMLKTHPA